MKIVCTGGRDYNDSAMVFDILSLLRPDLLYVGDASGADELVRLWQFNNQMDTNPQLQVFKADWDKHGRAAGPIRNKEMLLAAGDDAIVLAFPGGKGTEDCVKQAKKLNMVVLRVEK